MSTVTLVHINVHFAFKPLLVLASSRASLLADGTEGGTFRPLHIFSSHAKRIWIELKFFA
jgi:hypothetical protein